jgi:hypothetical protein
MKKESIIAPPSWYTAFNLPVAVLYGIIFPISVGYYLEWSMLVIIIFSAIWFIVNGRIIDRWIPVLTTPIIHTIYRLTNPSK